ncbi:TPA: Arc family DNA-binding protein [Pseudomonas aeruginosa]
MKDDDLIRNINPFGLRMQPALRAKVEEAASQNHRSLNAEIVARLESSFDLDSNIDRPVRGVSISEDGTQRTFFAGPSPKELFKIIHELAEEVRLLREGREKDGK